MTPKEKAKELVDKFAIKDELGWFVYSPKPFTYAKQCALIAVDEILFVSITFAGREYDFYQDVKKEIQIL